LPGFINRLEMHPMYFFLFHVGKETFAPGIVSRHPGTGETLPHTMVFQQTHHHIGCILTASITVENGAVRQVPSFYCLSYCVCYQFALHMFCHAFSQDHVAYHISDLAYIAESLLCPDVADVTRNHLERFCYLQPLCQIFIPISAGFPTVCQASLPSSPVNRYHSHFLHQMLYPGIGGLGAVFSHQSADPVHPVGSTSFFEIFPYLFPVDPFRFCPLILSFQIGMKSG